MPVYEAEHFDDGLRSDYVSSPNERFLIVYSDNTKAKSNQVLMPLRDNAETTESLIMHESSAKTSEKSSEPHNKRQKNCQLDLWNASRNQKNREKGKAYMGKKKIDNKWQFNELKPKRQLKERCDCKLSVKKNTKIQCYNITDDDRVKIWQNFWQLTWSEKKKFVKSFSVCKNKERVRSGGPTSRRKHSVELFLLSDSNKKRFRVCKTMFLNTLSIGEWAIRKWIVDEQDK